MTFDELLQLHAAGEHEKGDCSRSTDMAVEVKVN